MIKIRNLTHFPNYDVLTLSDVVEILLPLIVFEDKIMVDSKERFKRWPFIFCEDYGLCNTTEERYVPKTKLVFCRLRSLKE